MKTILVPVGGTDADRLVFETALAAARLFGAHLEFLHVHIDSGHAAARTPHADFARGDALTSLFAELDTKAELRESAATRAFDEFRVRHSIASAATPSGAPQLTAHWRAESGDGLPQLIYYARRHDLVVLGRPTAPNGLPFDFLERLLMESGRPLLIAGARAPRNLAGTIMVCWKESAQAARALGAAMPLLAKADRIIIVGVAENGDVASGALKGLADQLAWHGIAARTGIVTGDPSVPAALFAAAKSSQADLLVMGGYGRSRMSEVVFGGVTQAVLDGAELPVFLLH